MRGIADWFLEHDQNYQIYVIAIADKIIGWGSISPYRKGRAALKDTAEISYYIDFNYQGRGFGKKLISYIIVDCNRLGIKNLIAFLLEINEKSISILESFGFSRWGFLPGIVNLIGVNCAHVIYGKKLNENIEM